MSSLIGVLQEDVFLITPCCKLSSNLRYIFRNSLNSVSYKKADTLPLRTVYSDCLHKKILQNDTRLSHFFYMQMRCKYNMVKVTLHAVYIRSFTYYLLYIMILRKG